MMNTKQLNKKVEERMKTFSLKDLEDFTKLMPESRINLIENRFHRGPYLYYQWLYSLMKEIQPKKVIELGAHWGTGTAVFLAGMPKDSSLISVENGEIIPDEEAWQCVPTDTRLTKVFGNDLDLINYPKDFDFRDIDIWFIDSSHEEIHVRKEIDLFSPFWKEGTIIVMDDIDHVHPHEVYKVWKDLDYDKISLPHIHYSGFGFFIV